MCLCLCKLSAQVKPVIRLDTKMHTAPINCIAADNKGEIFITCSSDRTVKVWAKDGRLQKTIRVPISDAQKVFFGNREGVLNACDISPDGRFIVVGGFTGLYWNDTFSAYIYETYTGRLLQKIEGFEHIIQFIKISPDGKFIAIGANQDKIALYSAEDFRHITSLCFEDQNIYSVDISSESQLAVACYSDLKIYNLHSISSKPVFRKKMRKIKSISFNHNGKLLAIVKNKKVEVLDLKKNKSIYRFDEIEANKVCFSGREDNLFVVHHNNKDVYCIDGFTEEKMFLSMGYTPYKSSILSSGEQYEFQHINLHNTPNNICSDQNGGIFFTYNGASWLNKTYNTDTISPTGCHVPDYLSFLQGSGTLKENSSQKRLSISASDGNLYSFNLESKTVCSESDSLLIREQDLIKKNLKRQTKKKGSKIDTLYTLRYTQHINNLAEYEGLSVKISKDTRIFSPDNKTILIKQTQNTFKEDHKEFCFLNSDVLNIISSTNNNYILGSFSDGTIKWYSVAPFKEVLSLFFQSDGTWILWTPEGFYDCSPGGETLLTIQEGLGLKVIDRSISFEWEKYYKPTIINNILNSIYKWKNLDDQILSTNLTETRTRIDTLSFPKGNLNALLIGIGIYDDGSSLLPSSKNDVDRMLEIMEHQSGFYTNINRPTTLIDLEVTQQNVCDQLTRIEDVSQDNDLSVLYITGHGEKDKEGELFFPLLSSNDSLLLSSSTIAERIHKIKGTKLLIIDACYSGQIITDFTHRGYLSNNDIIILTSSHENKKSTDLYDQFKNSAFTHALVSAINGEVVNNDGIIYLKQLILYIEQTVQRNTFGEQQPQFFIPKQLADFKLFKTLENER